MKINFNVKYSTVFGQNLYLTGNHPKLGNNDIKKAVPLQFLNEKEWGKTLAINISSRKILKYQYILKDERTGEVLTEWKTRLILLHASPLFETFYLFDTWSAAYAIDELYETDVFKVFSFHHKKQPLTKVQFTHQFEINVPCLKENEVAAIIGNISPLKNWDTSQVIQMKRIKENHFAVRLDLKETDTIIEYKYGIYNLETKKFSYEEGENRYTYPLKEKERSYIKDEGFNYLLSDRYKGAGVAVPVFSLRSKQGLGIGEFLDLKRLGDWAKTAGIQLIQILPIHDTTVHQDDRDSSPYNIISAFALHPQYLNIQQLAQNMPKDFQQKIQQKADELNLKDKIPYSQIIAAKHNFIQRIFELEKTKFLKDPLFLEFFDRNKSWLIPYAVFSVLRDENKTANFTKWKHLAIYHEKSVRKYAEENESVQCYYFIQFHLHQQLVESIAYLHQKGIALKGDLAIGVYRYSCETWMVPELYHLKMQTGSPPDNFSEKGQNWQFPAYNWNKMEKNQFKWWKDRMKHLSQYFDSLRIDHILGFFRIWQIPEQTTEGKTGFFSPAHPFTISELQEKNILFDEMRFCQPFINEEVLDTFFEKDKVIVKKVFLEDFKGQYRLKRKLNTQQKVLHFIKKNPAYSYLKRGLFDLLANVLFIKEGKGFHPRYKLMKTHSYKFLDDKTKENLKNLHEDYFYLRNEDLWERNGTEKLWMIRKATNMLICGENLGMMPACVPETMKKAGILGLEIQRMPKDPSARFVDLTSLSYLNVVSPSSHDTSTLRAWLEEDPERTIYFFNTVLKDEGNTPVKLLVEALKKVVQQHFNSPAMWAILPIQDYLGMSNKLLFSKASAAQINFPSDGSHVWNYRLHLNLEALIKENAFNHQIHQMIKEGKRDNARPFRNT